MGSLHRVPTFLKLELHHVFKNRGIVFLPTLFVKQQLNPPSNAVFVAALNNIAVNLSDKVLLLEHHLQCAQ